MAASNARKTKKQKAKKGSLGDSKPSTDPSSGSVVELAGVELDDEQKTYEEQGSYEEFGIRRSSSLKELREVFNSIDKNDNGLV